MSFGWDYPPGVSGGEYEISGPDAEYIGERVVVCYNDECPRFEEKQDVEIELSAYRYTEWGQWDCGGCDKTDEYEGERDNE